MEQKVAKLEQRVEDLLVSINTRFDGLNEDVRAFAPMAKQVGEMQHHLTLALDEARGARVELGELRKSLQDRAEAQRVESKADRRYLIGAIFTAAALIVAAVGVLQGFG